MARRVLIADGIATNRIAFKAALAAARYEVTAVASAAEAVAELALGRDDLAIVDGGLADLDASGLTRLLAARPHATPPCLVAVDEDSTEIRASWIERGAAGVLLRPVDRPWLLTHLRALLRAREAYAELSRQVATAARMGFAESPATFERAPVMAVVANDRAAAGRVRRGLDSRLGARLEALTPDQILGGSESTGRRDLVVLADEGEDSLWLLSELRSHPGLKRAAILVENAADDGPRGTRALDLGANALLRRDAGPRERAAIIRRALAQKLELDRLVHQLDANLRMAARDHLTGLYNRRYAMQHLADLAGRTRADGRGYGVIIADVDHFKRVNDRLGHAAGDAILAEVAARLQSNLRGHDMVARIGGEEFLIALPDTTPAQALIAAERLREAISSRPIYAAGEAQRITVSLGIACSSDASPDMALQIADAALYSAKAAGRDCTRLGEAPRPLHPAAAPAAIAAASLRG